MVIIATPTIARHPPIAILVVSDSSRKNIPPNTEVTVSIARGDTSELETYFFTVTGRLVDVD